MAFVEEVAEHIKEATWLLQGVEGPKVAAVLKEPGPLDQRVWLIQIVDRYELGWAMLAEYETNKLARRREVDYVSGRGTKEGDCSEEVEAGGNHNH